MTKKLIYKSLLAIMLLGCGEGSGDNKRESDEIINTTLEDYQIHDSSTVQHRKAYNNLGARRWNNKRIEWWYNPKGQRVGTTNQILETINQAMLRWEEVSSVNFIYKGLTNENLSNSSDNKFIIGWLTQGAFENRFGSFSAYARVWWNGTNVKDAEISINQGKWSSSNSLSDFQGLLTHELGHTIGLDHADIEESIMFANPYHSYQYQATLRQYDINDIQALYPLSRPPNGIHQPLYELQNQYNNIQVLSPVSTWTTGMYKNNAHISQVLSIKKARSLKVTINGETEHGYDYISIYNENGVLAGKFDGKISEILTVNGSSIKAILTSDNSIRKEGVTISISLNKGLLTERYRNNATMNQRSLIQE